jgi:hypothetical protein
MTLFEGWVIIFAWVLKGYVKVTTDEKAKQYERILLYLKNYLCAYISTVLLLDLGRFFSFSNIQSVGLLRRGISPSQDRCLHTEETHTDIHALSGIRTHDTSVRASEDSSCLRPLWSAFQEVLKYIIPVHTRSLTKYMKIMFVIINSSMVSCYWYLQVLGLRHTLGFTRNGPY